MSLHPHPILKKMQDSDSLLFPKKSEGKFNSYSRTCAKPLATTKAPNPETRLPVILSEEEYADISSKYPNTYEKALSYESEKGKKFWYICPEYWGIKENRSLTQAEVDSGDFGIIIPDKAKTVPPGGNVLKFNKEFPYPGFIEASKHPNGKCMPCCFKKWDSKQQRDRRKACQDIPKEGKDVSIKNNQPVRYIQGPDRFPLDENVNGFIEPRILHFLGLDKGSVNCNKDKKQNCFLRRGVEVSSTQSFLSAISKLSPQTRKFTILQMKQHLMSKINIDNYVEAQNGNLVDMFDDGAELDENVIENYNDSNLFRITELNNDFGYRYLFKVIRSFINFQRYIMDKEVTIDHTYLWDLICMKTIIDEDGINLVILEINDDDITYSVNVLCPTNFYSKSVFDITKKTAILYKKGDYFEPIFHQISKKTDEFLFSVDSNSKIGKTLLNIKDTMHKYCRAVNDSTLYDFEQNIPLDLLLIELDKIKNQDGEKMFVMTKYILNYNRMVIGVLVKKSSSYEMEETKSLETDVEDVMLPCRPSSLIIPYDKDFMLDTTEYIWIDEVNPRSYQATVEILTNISQKSNEVIKCKPIIRVKNQGVIIGILTNANQFVPVLDIMETSLNDELITINDGNYKETEVLLTRTETDSERVDTITAIKIESMVYNMFRTTIRVVLGYTKNLKFHDEIERIVDSNYPYIQKLDRIVEILHSVVDEHVSFITDQNEIILDNIKLCVPISETADEECKLKIPEINLFNGLDNRKVYFGRIADELLRYSVMRSFILADKDDDTLMRINDVKLELSDEEILMWKSELTQEYFKKLKKVPINKYKKREGYETLFNNAFINETSNDVLNRKKNKDVTWKEFNNKQA